MDFELVCSPFYLSDVIDYFSSRGFLSKAAIYYFNLNLVSLSLVFWYFFWLFSSTYQVNPLSQLTIATPIRAVTVGYVCVTNTSDSNVTVIAGTMGDCVKVGKVTQDTVQTCHVTANDNNGRRLFIRTYTLNSDYNNNFLSEFNYTRRLLTDFLTSRVMSDKLWYDTDTSSPYWRKTNTEYSMTRATRNTARCKS